MSLPSRGRTVVFDEGRAMGMLAIAIAKTEAYKYGMPSTKVQAALNTHYGTTSRTLAGVINIMLGSLLL